MFWETRESSRSLRSLENTLVSLNISSLYRPVLNRSRPIKWINWQSLDQILYIEPYYPNSESGERERERETERDRYKERERERETERDRYKERERERERQRQRDRETYRRTDRQAERERERERQREKELNTCKARVAQLVTE
jgi:hypothetical protein